jgi:hypothetical protein
MSGTEEASAPTGPAAQPSCARRNFTCFGSSFCAAALAVAAFVLGACLSNLLHFIGTLDGGDVIGIAFLCALLAIILRTLTNIWLFLRTLVRGMHCPPDAARRKRAITCTWLGLACFAPPFAFAAIVTLSNDEASRDDVMHALMWVLRLIAVVCFLRADNALRKIKQRDEAAVARLKRRAAILLTLGVASLAIPALMQMWGGS